MDFTLSDEQAAIFELAGRILTEKLPPERLKEIEQGDRWFADDVWAELAKADLLGLALPDQVHQEVLDERSHRRPASG